MRCGVAPMAMRADSNGRIDRLNGIVRRTHGTQGGFRLKSQIWVNNGVVGGVVRLACAT